MTHFKAIADDLGIKVCKIRKDSPHLGDLKDDCVIIALSIMTEKPYNIIKESINKIARDNDSFRTDVDVFMDFINNYNKNAKNKYIFVPLKKTGICYNVILRNKDKDLLILNNSHVFCYVNGKILDTANNYLVEDVIGCTNSTITFERIKRPNSYKFKKIERKEKSPNINSLVDSKFLLKSLNNSVKVLEKSNEQETTLSNLPILTLSRLTGMPYKEAAMSLVLFDDKHIGISNKLLYSYFSETYEIKTYDAKGNYNLYSFLTSSNTKKTSRMVIYIAILFGSWKDEMVPIAVKDGVIQSTVDYIEILLASPVYTVQYISTK